MPLTVNKSISVLTGAMLAAMPILYMASSQLMGREYLLFYWSIACLSLIGLTLAGRTGSSATIGFNRADLLIAGYILYCLFNTCVLNGRGLDGITVWKWAAVISGYVLIRLLPDKKPVVGGLVLSAVIQSGVAIGQKAGIIASKHLLFDVTGSFGNPGQLGGFLAVGFIAALALATDRDNSDKIKQYSYIAATFLIAAGLLLADSRASLVAILVGTVYIFRKWIYTQAKKPYVAIIAVLFVIAAAATVFSYRPGSASARLLIWRVSMDMVRDNPVSGHGAGSFEKQYLDYQGRYFAEHPDSGFLMVADNAAYAYNEAIHLVIEQGLVGLSLIALIFIALFSGPCLGRTDRAVRGGLVAWIGFAMFSYPVSVAPMMLLLGVLAGASSVRARFTTLLPRWLIYLSLAFIAAGILLSAQQLRFYRRCNDPVFADAYFGRIRYNPTLNDGYMSRLFSNGEYGKLISLRADAFPTTGLYSDLGRAYAEAGMYREAEECYIRASNIVPTRFMPRFMLWEMYVSQDDTARALTTAKALLEQPLKVENTLTLRKKAELRKFIEQEGRPQDE